MKFTCTNLNGWALEILPFHSASSDIIHIYLFIFDDVKLDFFSITF